VTLLGAFLAHESVTQFRSTRFRAMSLIYVIVSLAPVMLVFLAAGRARYAIGTATYVLVLDTVQPLVTMLFAAVLSVDAITREREEGSFPVVALAPISAAGYLLRRWISVVLVALPVTLVPRLIATSLVAIKLRRLPMLGAFAEGWLLYAVLLLVIVSGFALALGTINGSSIVALVTAMMLLTAGLGFVNDVAAHWHRQFDGIARLFAANLRLVSEIRSSIRGNWQPQLPTEAGYPFEFRRQLILPVVALLSGLTAALLGIATIYLRRTRRDIRPLRVDEHHQLRSFIRLFNRLRDAYSPDGSIGATEWASIVLGLALAAGSIGYLDQCFTFFERLGTQKYAAHTQVNPLPMTADVVPVSARIRGTVARDGRLRSHAELALRNRGTQAVRHLGFELNQLVNVRLIRTSRGSVRLDRVWQRVGIDVDPPLAAGETRTFAFELEGRPGEVGFPLPWAGDFRAKWRRYRDAKTAVDLSDLSRSYITPAIDEAHVYLTARNLIPVPRYTEWRVDADNDRFVPEAVEPPAPIDLLLAQPFGAVADSCGHLAANARPLESRCTMALASYVIAGGPLVTRSIAPGIMLSYIPVHEALARVQGPALASAVARAEGAWNGLTLPRPIVYVERPAGSIEERWENAFMWRQEHDIGGSGTLQLIPENTFNRYTAIDEGTAAAAMIVNALRTRRAVAPQQAPFFLTFYRILATDHVGGRSRRTAVVPSSRQLTVASGVSLNGLGHLPFIARMIEARAGANHVVEGVNDFVAAPGTGTARELFDAIGRRAGIDLGRAHDDFITGEKLPRLTMEEVTFQRSGAAWEVRGVLHNDGTGEAYCPLALRTATGSLWQTLRTDGGERVPFVFHTDAEPHTLQLDPDRVCYRQAFVGAIESVDHRGES
jgi:hypothetical protein